MTVSKGNLAWTRVLGVGALFLFFQILLFAASCRPEMHQRVSAEEDPEEDPVPQKVLASISRDLNRDGRLEKVRITCNQCLEVPPMGGMVEVYGSGPGKKTSPFRLKGLNPWKLMVGDVDGDGILEVAIGVYKKSRYDPVMERRPFFYNWKDGRLVPKWLGSRLSRRFDDFILVDLNGNGRDEIVALERLEEGVEKDAEPVDSADGRGFHVLGVYRWKSFGFEWLGESDHLKGAAGLTAYEAKVKVSGRDGKVINCVEWSEEKCEEEVVCSGSMVFVKCGE